MPKYEYACKSCDEHIEVVQSFAEDPLTQCASCGGPLRKVFAAPGIAFKGSGFYRTDNRKRRQEPKEAKAEANAGGSDAKSDTATKTNDGGSEAGPATKEPAVAPAAESKPKPTATEAKTA